MNWRLSFCWHFLTSINIPSRTSWRPYKCFQNLAYYLKQLTMLTMIAISAAISKGFKQLNANGCGFFCSFGLSLSTVQIGSMQSVSNRLRSSNHLDGNTVQRPGSVVTFFFVSVNTFSFCVSVPLSPGALIRASISLSSAWTHNVTA